MSQLLSTIIVLIAILIFWFIFRLLFRKLVEPHKVFIHGPGTKSDANKLGYLATEKKSTSRNSTVYSKIQGL